jgi:hypothetical protein
MPIAQSAKTCEYFIVRECEQKYDEDASLEIVLQGADSFTYEYDFNLFWKINIKILSDHDTEEDYPQLLKYEGKMARDDCHSIAELNKKYRYAVHQKLINDTLIGMFED